MKRSVRNLAFILGTMTACSGTAPTGQMERPQDVVVVILCTARSDQFTGWGAPNDTTPYLFEQVTKGAFFEQTIAQAPWTKPASVAILTGHHPAAVGMVEPEAGRNDRAVSSKVILLSERLQSAGFQTLGVTANPNLNGHFGFNQGFEQYIEMSPLMRDGGVKVLAQGVASALESPIQNSDPSRPLYVQAMLVDAHRPFNVKPRHQRATDGAVPKDVQRYRSALRQLDEGFKTLYASMIRARPGLEDALWVVVGDHGEGLSFPKHHGTSHGTTLYPSVTQVPLGMWGAGIPEGSRVSGLSAQVDVVPTVLGLMGLPEVDTLSGTDFSSLLKQGGGDSPRNEAYTSTWFRWSKRAARYDAEGMCQRDFNIEATRRQLSKAKPMQGLYAFPDGCFDIAKDPMFETPILNQEKHNALGQWFHHRSVENEHWQAQIDKEIPDGIDAQLKALGYAE